MEKRKYDSTVARMAGNIAAGWIGNRTVSTGISLQEALGEAARLSVALARLIISEVERTEPSSKEV